MAVQEQAVEKAQGAVKGWAYCPICTRTVEAPVVGSGRKVRVRPGEKCPRCSSSLEAACVVRYETAA